jgi:hypothetical protein
MTTAAHSKVYTQCDWTDQALIADGFQSYAPVKRIVMVRMLPPEEAPKTMKASGNMITAEAGYWIAYVAGDELQPTLDDYKPRPIEPDIFAVTYRPWDEPIWRPTPTQSHLRRLGCLPYYKFASVWAKQLTAPTWVQSIESSKPSLVAPGKWLCVGMEGEPWSMTDAWFRVHYLSDRHAHSRAKIDEGAHAHPSGQTDRQRTDL